MEKPILPGNVVELDKIREKKENKKQESEKNELGERLDNLFDFFEDMDDELSFLAGKEDNIERIYDYLINKVDLKKIIHEMEDIMRIALESDEDIFYMLSGTQTAASIFYASYESGEFDKLNENDKYKQLTDFYNSILVLLAAKRYFAKE